MLHVYHMDGVINVTNPVVGYHDSWSTAEFNTDEVFLRRATAIGTTIGGQWMTIADSTVRLD